jgi:hypothetical protein
MGVVSTHTMVTGTTGSGFIGYFSASNVGSMSPSTSDAIGTSPSIIELYHGFGFTLLKFSGYFDNSSITGLSLTPSGGSTFTMTFGSFSRDEDDNYTLFSDGSGSTLSNNTTYTVEILGDTTSANTEGTTLERRNPKDFNDFYGATRNVPPASGALKLSWLKNAVKYKYSATMTAGEYVYESPLPDQTARGWQQYFPQIGSITNKFLSGMINEYSGQQLVGILEFAVPSSNPSYYQLNFTIQTTQPGGPNNQWYLLKIGNALYYREDATYSVDTATTYWTMWSWQGSTQNIANSTNYTVEVIC